MNVIDLHVHTTASDGTMSPAELVRYAKGKGLRTIAITDHDTIEGIEEGLQEGSKRGLEVIPGVELSVDYSNGTMHLLGYYIDITCTELTDKLMVLQQARAERNLKMIDKLRALGMEIDLAEVATVAEHGQIGRPHFAQAMVKKGYVQNIPDAFDRYLRKGGPAYMEKFRLSAEEAIHVIRTAGGVTVLAHPFTLNQPQPHEFDAVIGELKQRGLEGIEVHYPEHSEGQKKLYRDVAQQYGLLITGGSDFHGLTKDAIDLGEGYGDGELTHTIVEDMKSRRETRRKGP